MQVKNNSKFIVFVLGGISHQEIAALANFERQQIIYGAWPQERLIIGSTEQKPLTGRDMLKMLSNINLNEQQEEYIEPPNLYEDEEDQIPQQSKRSGGGKKKSKKKMKVELPSDDDEDEGVVKADHIQIDMEEQTQNVQNTAEVAPSENSEGES